MNYTLFEGRNVEQMPKLIAAGLKPISVKDLIEARLKGKLNDAYVDTGDACVIHSSGRMKIVYDSETLRNLTPETELVNGAVVLSDEEYEKLKGKEFSKKEVDSINESPQVRDKLWFALARSKKLFEKYKQKTGVIPYICLWEKPSRRAELRLWCVSRLNGNINNSGAYGGSHLGNDDGRLVGVSSSSSGAKEAKVKSLTMKEKANLYDKIRNMVYEANK